MIEKAACFLCKTDGFPTHFSVPATTKRWVIAQCPNGHAVGVVFQASGWARLFERGLRRLALGDTRDAILDVYTAFEMYLAEVPIRARYHRELGASPATLREELKQAISRSDCATGAARATASLASGKPEITWSEHKTTAVRNRAVHSGTYPSEEEAQGLCLEVERVILEFETTFKDVPCVNQSPFHQAIWKEEVEEFRKAHPDIQPSFAFGGLVFDWVNPPESRVGVAARIEEYRKEKHLGS